MAEKSYRGLVIVLRCGCRLFPADDSHVSLALRAFMAGAVAQPPVEHARCFVHGRQRMAVAVDVAKGASIL
jgi:hypothetical protein